MDTDTRKALREVAAGKLDGFTPGELEDLGLRPTGSMDDDDLMQQAERLLRAGTGDAHAEIDGNLRSRLDELHNLQRLANPGVDLDEWSNDELLDLDIGYGVAGALSREYVQEAAEERLNGYPLAVEATTTFEVVIGTGGPDQRLLFECSGVDTGPYDGGGDRWEIDRVLYRYSWTGSAERVLSGEDRETAEELARRVVSELSR